MKGFPYPIDVTSWWTWVGEGPEGPQTEMLGVREKLKVWDSLLTFIRHLFSQIRG